jgi:serine/threonine protein kinase
MKGGEVFYHNRYTMIETLGRGAFGTVIKVKDEKDQTIPM